MEKRGIVELILGRLHEEETELTQEFGNSASAVGVRYCVVDDLLPPELAERIYGAFPKKESMRLMDSFREKEFTSKNFAFAPGGMGKKDLYGGTKS